MGNIGQVISDLLLIVPAWVLVLVAVVILILGIPGYRYAVRERQIRERVRRLVRAEATLRDQLIEEAIALAHGDPHLLALMVREARKRTQPRAAARALEVLDAGDEAAQNMATRLRGEVTVQDPMLGRPQAIAAAALALLEAGNPDAARARVDAALELHPTDPVLRAAALRIASESPTASASPLDASAGDP